MKRVCITIDVEDWFQSVIYRDLYPVEGWKDKKLMVREPLKFLLDTFDRMNIKCTFFVLGWFAESYPDIVRDIHKRGHEIGSHGMTHVPNNRLDNDGLVYEISESKRQLESVIGDDVLGYRASSYSISERVLEEIHRSGYRYDSSFTPVKGNALYGNLKVETIGEFEKKGLRELAVPTGKFMGKTIPFAGGTYLRILPIWFLKKQIEKLEQDTLIMYFHPGDFDSRLPKWKELPRKYRLRHCMGIRGNDKKFIKLLNWLHKGNYEFKRLRDLL